MINLFGQVYKTQFLISDEERELLYNKIVKEHLILSKAKHYENIRGNNFIMGSSYSFFNDKLIKFFIEESRKLCSLRGNWVSSDPYAYVSNKENYGTRNKIHDHRQNCMITGVYYLNIPSSKSGQLYFFNNANDEKIFEYQPKNDDFIIMPSYVRHNPQKSSTKKYRISINLGIAIK